MGTDEEAFNDKQLKKPSLQSRLQSGRSFLTKDGNTFLIVCNKLLLSYIFMHFQN